ncbi:MAG TPA: hypothetical protein VG367_14700 [Mucilaginibacter sp.]|jgi:hypothetical protein|nr:hypothetical protein [Mucilaginibacter sp.]
MRTLFIFIFTVVAGSAFAQSSTEDFKKALMKTKDGAEIAYTSNKHSFTFNIVADSIKPLQNPGYLIVNNKVIQYILIGNSALLASDSTQEKQKQQLLGYMQYELEYIRGELKIDYQNLHNEWLDLNGKTFLLWYYDMPPNSDKKANVTKQINLSTMCFTHVLNMNTPFEMNDDLEKDKHMLTAIAETLKMNNFTIDFNELYKKLNGGG